jgi:hypothetical protein
MQALRRTARMTFGLLTAFGCSHVDHLVFEPAAPTVRQALRLSDSEASRLSCARAAVERAVYSLPEEDFRTFRQLRLPEHPPLQRFPRLTAPYFTPTCEERWYVPVLFERWTKETMRPMSAAQEAEAVPERRFDVARPEQALAFWLEPAGSDGSGHALIPVLKDQIIPLSHLPGLRCCATERLAGGTAVVLELTVDPGFYWIRIVPRFDDCENCSAFAKSVSEGDLPAILEGIRDRQGLDDLDLPRLGIEGLADLFGCQWAGLRFGLDDCKHPYKHFWPEMREVTKQARCKDGPELVAALRALYEGEFSPAGVLLDEPRAGSEAFSFAIGADTQNSTDMSAFQRFLQVLEEGAQDAHSMDPTRSPLRVLRYEPAWKSTAQALRNELRRLRSRIHFVLIAGDLGDARAGSDLRRMALNVLGLYPPISTYETEYPTMAREIRRLPVPFVAVPGNHDGMVGYPGLLNRFANLPGLIPFLDATPVQRLLDRANDYIPVFLKIPWPERVPWGEDPDMPRYDGLAEWAYALGPTSYVFEHRGQTFAGFNSFHLTPRERAGLGSVIFDWGGGVPDRDVVSLEERIDRLQRPHSNTFLYMHHDPRAGTPLKRTLEVDRFGVYDEIDIAASALTLGHFGLGQSPSWDVFIPVVTPLVSQSTRLLDDWLSGRGRTQQEWMQRSFAFCWDEGYACFRSDDYTQHKGADRLVDAIGDRLYTDERGGISHVFFGHNDVPLGPDQWAHTQSDRHVFVELPQGEWHEGREYHHHYDTLPFLPWGKWPAPYIFKMRNDEPPDWAKAEQPERGNAAVIRLDDVANPGGVHGFHLVTVVPRACAGPCGADVHVKWFALPTKRDQ